MSTAAAQVVVSCTQVMGAGGAAAAFATAGFTVVSCRDATVDLLVPSSG